MNRYQLRPRSARVQTVSLDPEYVPKVDYLCQCLREAALAPGMGARWAMASWLKQPTDHDYRS